ncbi:ApeA N-terminal domain 1-containing protein [Nocardioides stalactiti]|uniref:ApeA N-terminal domain 1-containing protein n=1 Tax=Nocardioides stalactiti TaxID=2755356 RepID=UPI0016010B3E|nr:hypothetical protein [Nocardioides stalactiti]
MAPRSTNDGDNQSLDALGYWWLPDHEDHKVPGRFTWDPEKGGDLDLLGELIPLNLKDNVLASGRVQKYRERRTKLQNQFSVIHGVVRQQAYTLLNSFSLNGIDLSGLEESPEHVATNGVLVGAWYIDSDDVEADRAIVHMRHLTEWIDTDSLITRHPHLDGDPDGPYVTITARQAPTFSARFADTEIRVFNELEPTGDRHIHSGVNHSWRLAIAADEMSRLEKFTDIATDIRALVTIGTGKTADIEKVVLQHPNLARHNLAGQPIPKFRDDITYYSRWSHRSIDTEPVERREMYFNLAQLGGPDVITRWLLIAATYPTELRRVMATRYTDTMYLEDRISNTCAALESFDEVRRTVQKGEATFKERVRASVANAGPPFASLIVGTLDEWLTSVVRARNDLAHHGAGFRLNATAGEHLLAEQLYWLFAMNLLREAEAGSGVFERIADHRELQWLVRQAREGRDAE